MRGGDSEVVEVRETRHGPLLTFETVGVSPIRFVPLEAHYALRWTGTDGLIEPAALVDIAAAKDFDGFRQALRRVSCPGRT